jgi:hypothetical protein
MAWPIDSAASLSADLEQMLFFVKTCTRHEKLTKYRKSQKTLTNCPFFDGNYNASEKYFTIFGFVSWFAAGVELYMDVMKNAAAPLSSGGVLASRLYRYA